MNVGEVVKGLRNALLADLTLRAMLGAVDAFYLDIPAGKVPFPCLILDVKNWNPQTKVSATGVYRPQWQLDIFAVNPYDAMELWGRLENAWTIPLGRPTPIETDSYRITQMVWGNAVDAGPFRVVDSGEQVRMWACELGLKIVEKTGARAADSSSGP